MLRQCIPALLLAPCLAQSPQATAGELKAGAVPIPAELTTTIKAEKVKRGDPVEFRTMQPVLLGHGVVMPADAKLTGRIVGAAARHGEKPSWLVLVVERAEWKQQVVRLHAFITAELKFEKVSAESMQPTDLAATLTSPSRPIRRMNRIMARDPASISNGQLPQDTSGEVDAPVADRPTLAKDILLVTDKDGIVYLFSGKSNIHLPSGLAVVLQNQPTREGSTAEAPETLQSSAVRER